ncbi:helix-turn-helix domain-containing protein [Shewanella youngdeokensis]
MAQARKALGFTQTQVAEQLGITPDARTL